MESEDAVLRQAMAIVRSRRDPVKLAEHARAIGEALRGVPMSDEHKAKLKAAQAVRREREKQERAALGLDATPTEKKQVGRPAKSKPDATNEPKRPRGRPKRQDGQTTAGMIDAPETGVEGQGTA
jgi:hypothetical protein